MMDLSGLSVSLSYSPSQDDFIAQIHTILQDTVASMLQTHHSAISDLLNAMDSSHASTFPPSRGDNDDDTNLTGTAFFGFFEGIQ